MIYRCVIIMQSNENKIHHEMNSIIRECDRLQKNLHELESKFLIFEKKLDATKEPDAAMIQEYIVLKKEHLRTRWNYMKIANRRRKLKKLYNV